jgi:RND family efflux transporter MFP subunit
MQTSELPPPRTGTHAERHDGQPHDAGHDEIDLNVREPRPLWVILAGVLAVAALAALLLTGLIPRHRQAKELEADAEAATGAPVQVEVAAPKRAAPVLNVALPGTLRPWQEVSIFARTSGYLKKYYVDISNSVEPGQLLAEIETPETDQELRQAEAAVLQTKAAVTKAVADRDLAKTTWERYRQLVSSNFLSQQEAAEKEAALNAAEATLQSVQANVAAAEANVRRFTELQQFQKVSAPFGGVVTGRGYDVGSLITANPTAADTRPLFKIAANDVLRAFVNVPQSTALQIRKGMKVKVTARERAGRVFEGYVMGTTNYLDPANRSLLTQIKVPNVKEADGSFALLPGMFVQVSLEVNRDAPPLLIPAPALVNNSDGMRVATVKDGLVRFRPVTLGQDFGNEVEVLEGLAGDELVIANPGERTVEGAAVVIAGARSTPHPAEKVANAVK